MFGKLPESTKDEIDLKIRTQFLFAMLYLLGLELVKWQRVPGNCFRQKDGQWWFFVKSKGDKLGHIPVHDKLLDYVKAYRQHLGKESLPAPYEIKRMIVSYKSRKAYSLRILYSIVKAVGMKASKVFRKNKQKKREIKKILTTLVASSSCQPSRQGLHVYGDDSRKHAPCIAQYYTNLYAF